MSGSRLAGKVAIVTGGATGIGRATARLFAAEGAQVVIADINESDGIAAAHEVQGLFIRTDVSSAEQAKAAVSRTVGELGGLHVLVNSAANLGGYHSATAMPEAEWREVLSASLDGVFHASKYAGIEMKSNGAGSIVNISSVEGLMGAANHAAYVTAKSALFGLTRSMAIDLGTDGVRVNSISPGIIDSGHIETEKADPAIMKFWLDMTVLRRLGRPDEIAATALFLASDEASYITGQNIVVDGGWTIGHPPVAIYDKRSQSTG
jgi:NAD(P)-dependent dehydrogenase (short-subunit alcohol dehydrogenase family)